MYEAVVHLPGFKGNLGISLYFTTRRVRCNALSECSQRVSIKKHEKRPEKIDSSGMWRVDRHWKFI